MKNHSIISLRCILEVYHLQSLTQAAKKLGLSKVSVSKRLTFFEDELGEALFDRTTRSVKPTQACEKLIPRIEEILKKVDELTEDTTDNEARGLIKITLNSTLAHTVVDDLLKEYQEEHPEILFEVIVTDSVLDFTENNIDIALRVNPSKNSQLIGKKLGDVKLFMVVSPKFLKKIKVPKALSHLDSIPFFAIDLHMTTISKSHKELVKKLEEQRLFRSNDSLLITKKLIEGQGYGIRSSWEAKHYESQGKLKIIFQDKFSPAYGDIWILSHPNKLKLERVKSFYNYLAARIPGKI